MGAHSRKYAGKIRGVNHKKVVIKTYPYAMCYTLKHQNTNIIYNYNPRKGHNGEFCILSGIHSTEDKAWEEAWNKILTEMLKKLEQ